MGILGYLKKVFVRKFWPWFKKFIWPIILKHIKEIIEFLTARFKEKLKKWASEEAEKKSKTAHEKAEEFEQKAKSAGTNEEAEKYKAIAEVWREVVEQYRRENEELKRKIDELSQEVRKEAFDKADNLDIDIDFSGKKPILNLGEASYELQQLPTEDDPENK